jgi:hypothetical protein
MMPVKDSHTRIKPLALANGHGRYMTVTPERALVSVGEWPLHISGLDLVSTLLSLQQSRQLPLRELRLFPANILTPE